MNTRITVKKVTHNCKPPTLPTFQDTSYEAVWTCPTCLDSWILSVEAKFGLTIGAEHQHNEKLSDNTFAEGNKYLIEKAKMIEEAINSDPSD